MALFISLLTCLLFNPSTKKMKIWLIPFKDDEMKKRVSPIDRLALIGVNASIPLTEACYAIVDKVFSPP